MDIHLHAEPEQLRRIVQGGRASAVNSTMVGLAEAVAGLNGKQRAVGGGAERAAQGTPLRPETD